MCVYTSWAWPALRVLAEGRVASLYQDLFWSVMQYRCEYRYLLHIRVVIIER